MKIHHATKAKAAKFKINLQVIADEIVATDKNGHMLASGLQGNKVLEIAITRQTGKPAKGTPEANVAFKAAVGALVRAGKVMPQKPAPKLVKLERKITAIDTWEELAKTNGWRKTRWGFSKEGEESVQAANWQELCEDQSLELEAEEEAESDADQSKSIVKAKYKAKYKPTKDKSGDDLSFRVNDHVSREDDAGELKIDLDALRVFAKANECWAPAYASFKSRTGGWNGGMAVMNCNNRLRARLRRIAKEQERPFDIDKDVVWK